MCKNKITIRPAGKKIFDLKDLDSSLRALRFERKMAELSYGEYNTDVMICLLVEIAEKLLICSGAKDDRNKG